MWRLGVNQRTRRPRRRDLARGRYRCPASSGAVSADTDVFQLPIIVPKRSRIIANRSRKEMAQVSGRLCTRVDGTGEECVHKVRVFGRVYSSSTHRAPKNVSWCVGRGLTVNWQLRSRITLVRRRNDACYYGISICLLYTSPSPRD